MKYSSVREILENIVELLIAGDFPLLWLNDLDQRIAAEEMSEAVSGYGTMTTPPPSSFEKINIYQTDDPNQVRIDFDLWFDGSKSDLTLKCTINSSQLKKYSIDDIRML